MVPSDHFKKDRRRYLRSKGPRDLEEGGAKEKETKQEQLGETNALIRGRQFKCSSSGALREPVLGPGLATALSTLRAKGDLREKFEWVGRTNDMKKVDALRVIIRLCSQNALLAV